MFLERLLANIKCEKIINKTGLSLSEIEISEVCCDSRKAKEGALFVCISGSLQDGHEYAREA